MVALKAKFDGRQIEVPPEMRGVEPREVLIVYDDKSTSAAAAASIWTVFGKAPNPRTKEDIDNQIREERESWGDR
ncbi:MAG: hypothetical protein WBD40_15580 [Tepidisphaeraceae bacterium]